MKNATTSPAKAAKKLLARTASRLDAPSAGTYEVLRNGSVYRVTVPPSACHGCGGDGCRDCAFTGENLPA